MATLEYRILSEYLGALQKRLVALSDGVLEGNAEDYADYRYRVGQFTEVRNNIDLLEDTRKKVLEGGS